MSQRVGLSESKRAGNWVGATPSEILLLEPERRARVTVGAKSEIDGGWEWGVREGKETRRGA